MALGDATTKQQKHHSHIAIDMMVTENKKKTIPNASVNFSSPDDLISADVKHQTISVSDGQGRNYDQLNNSWYIINNK